ncbi:MAG: hypothetical protein KGI38_11775 [Thaumarchaeota archaeon]|nr:hypothetical protein [Nitrososphaerota archaeon]
MSGQQTEHKEVPRVVPPPPFEKASIIHAQGAIILHLSGENTHLKYGFDVQDQQIRGLMKVGREVQKYRQEFIDYLKRAFGNIEGIWGGGFKLTGKWVQWLVLLAALFGTYYYLNSTGAGTSIYEYAQANALTVGAVAIFGFVAVLYVMSRRRAKRQ